MKRSSGSLHFSALSSTYEDEFVHTWRAVFEGGNGVPKEKIWMSHKISDSFEHAAWLENESGEGDAGEIHANPVLVEGGGTIVNLMSRLWRFRSGLASAVR